MPKQPKIESFETQEYSHPNVVQDKFAVIKQVAADSLIGTPHPGSPAETCHLTFIGNKMRVTFHCFEANMPTRIKEISATSNQSLDVFVKHVKAEYKKRTGEALKLKEDKNLANYAIEKVSLNSRYYFRAWRLYELS